MIKIIDYLFYRVSYVYIEKYKDKQGYILGGGLVTLMEIMHIGAVVIFIGIFSRRFNITYFEPLRDVNYLHSWTTIPALVHFGFNALFLNKRRYTKLAAYWTNEEKIIRKKRGYLIVLYIIANLSVTIGLGIYLNHHS